MNKVNRIKNIKKNSKTYTFNPLVVLLIDDDKYCYREVQISEKKKDIYGNNFVIVKPLYLEV